MVLLDPMGAGGLTPSQCPTCKLGHKMGWVGKQNPVPGHTEKMILPENSPKYRWWLRRDETQRSHRHRPAKAGRSPGTSPPKGSGLAQISGFFSPTVEHS